MKSYGTSSPVNKPGLCPCGSTLMFAACCEPVIRYDMADSAEALMRSRYTAYVLGYWDYLHTSWHPDTRPSRVSPATTDWVGLTIVRSTENSVEFIAGFRENGEMMSLHETSRFTKEGSHWRYVDGDCKVSKTACPIQA